GTAATLLTLLN
ncbi:hypothetical protein MJO29_007360, partial [Puccinia striiformis f. sp. tritici]